MKIGKEHSMRILVVGALLLCLGCSTPEEKAIQAARDEIAREEQEAQMYKTFWDTSDLKSSINLSKKVVTSIVAKEVSGGEVDGGTCNRLVITFDDNSTVTITAAGARSDWLVVKYKEWP
jgi:hypothetical protein